MPMKFLSFVLPVFSIVTIDLNGQVSIDYKINTNIHKYFIYNITIQYYTISGSDNIKQYTAAALYTAFKLKIPSTFHYLIKDQYY